MNAKKLQSADCNFAYLQIYTAAIKLHCKYTPIYEVIMFHCLLTPLFHILCTAKISLIKHIILLNNVIRIDMPAQIYNQRTMHNRPFSRSNSFTRKARVRIKSFEVAALTIRWLLRPNRRGCKYFFPLAALRVMRIEFQSVTFGWQTIAL